MSEPQCRLVRGHPHIAVLIRCIRRDVYGGGDLAVVGDGDDIQIKGTIQCQLVKDRVGKRPADGISQEKAAEDRKSTRLNSSHVSISYAVFCLKKKTPRERAR